MHTTDTGRILIGADTETARLAEANLTPSIVCLTTYDTGENGASARQLFGVGDGDGMIREVPNILLGEEVQLVFHNAAFDLAILGANIPDLWDKIWAALEAGRISCTKIREKLLILAKTGDLEFASLPDGSKVKLEYSLSALGRKYLGKFRESQKKESDAWRTNFDILADTHSSEWPAEARDYAIEDAEDAYNIWLIQEAERKQLIAERGIDPFVTEPFRVLFDFCLYLMSARGMQVDSEEKAKVTKMLEEELAPDKLDLLIETGILREAVRPRPFKKKPNKMTKGEEESVDMTRLREYVLKLAKDFPDEVKLKYTEPSARFPEGQLSTDSEWMEDHKHLSPVLGQFYRRASFQKLLTTELPRMCRKDADGKIIGDAEVVHPCYDVLKRTGRTSSFGSDTYPSFNCQNVDPRVRACFTPRKGYLFFSIDFSFMELVTWAQRCLELFGESRLAEIINAGWDPHAWLGSRLILTLDEDFRRQVIEPNGIDYSDQEAVYKAFVALKKCGSPEWEAAFKKWRTFAKPTGLGYPGGLGSKTFVAYAKATYGVHVTDEESKALREAWMQALPEAERWFDWAQNQVDPWHPPRVKEFKDGTVKEYTSLCYTTPMGMHRANTDFCAVANGAGLQSPSAEGAGLAVYHVVRSAYDRQWNSPLLGKIFPIMFIHDEICGEVLDDGYAGEYCTRTAEIMASAFMEITPNVKIKAQPVLMRRWDKFAEPTYDSTGRLIVTEAKA